MALDETDLDALVSEAAVILDEAAKPFVSGHGADSAVQKKGNDFATEVDLAIERQVVDALVSRPASRCTARSSAAPTSTRRWCGCSTRSTARSTTRPVCRRRRSAGAGA